MLYILGMFLRPSGVRSRDNEKVKALIEKVTFFDEKLAVKLASSVESETEI